MAIFTYHRRAKALRSKLLGLLAYAVLELTVWAIVISFMPRNWAIGTVAVLVLLVLWQVSFATRPLRNAHRLHPERLEVNFGHWYGVLQLHVPLHLIDEAGPVTERFPNGVDVGLEGLPRYHEKNDTLYLLTDKVNCVSLRLQHPLEVKLGKKGLVQFTRIVMTLDEPALFLERLSGAGVAARLADTAKSIAHDRVLSEPLPPIAPIPIAPAPTAPTPIAPAPIAPAPIAPAPIAPAPIAPAPIAPAPIAPAPPQPIPTGEQPALELLHLHKRYGDFTAVADLNLTVRRGEILAFLGSNGAGKTTTIKMMTGLLQPTHGRVLVHGHDVWEQGPAARRLLGYVPDVPLLHEGLTAREFLWMMAGLYEIPTPEGRRRANELLTFLGLERWGDHQIRNFSLGMKRKMSIAAALIHRPKVLLLDEVTNGLDPRSARDIKDFIMHTVRDGTAVLLTTHLLETAQELAHRIAMIDGGQLRAVGTLDELRQQAGLPEAGLEGLFLHFTDSGTKVGVSA